MKMDTNNPIVISACARAAHEANRAVCIATGQPMPPTWSDAAEDRKESMRNAMRVLLAEPMDAEARKAWIAASPPEQRREVALFVDVAHAVAAALKEGA